MERKKKSLDIRLILKELNIPIEKYEEWMQIQQHTDTGPLSQQYLETWKSADSALRRQKA
ncbi:MAG: hypothetical protein K0S39_1172 [Paenibacillus sp.]|nr:hypothetical protein [Paenibacillus sp.]